MELKKWTKQQARLSSFYAIAIPLFEAKTEKWFFNFCPCW
jgi:hypothetical protein